MKRIVFIVFVGMSLFFMACSSGQKPQQQTEQQKQNAVEQKTQDEMKQGMNNSETDMVRDTTPAKNQ